MLNFLNEFTGYYFFTHAYLGCLAFSFTEKGHFCSDEGKLDVISPDMCRYAAETIEYPHVYQFHEITVKDPLSKRIPANCSFPIQEDYVVRWNHNLAGKRNLGYYALCMDIGNYILV